ncbi:alpha/beta hydrolase [Cohnella boryungensis]|uniref:Alpha/beta hydrolase n=1 Tax=Cohnella boryungensis TaxID=768479 RepID=A0ABV8S6R7_9BACL
MFENVLPPIQTYEARDGRSLCYRHYGAASNKIILLLHGISEDGQCLHPLADAISKKGLAQVVVPDLRGYGLHPVRRGDVEYVGQHDHDIEDLVKWLRGRDPGKLELILAGHSGGGGNVIRLARHRLAQEVSAYLLLAPFVHPEAPNNAPAEAAPGTLRIDMPRVRLLSALGRVGLRFWHNKIVLRNEKPSASRHGRETLELSYRLLLSRMPKAGYARELRAMTQPTLVLVGEQDEVFLPGQYAPMFAEHNRAEVRLIRNCGHDGILVNKEAHRLVEHWLRKMG